MLFVGGLRPRHVIGAYEDLGMEVVGTGYEFGHADDYDRTLKEMGNATLLYDDVTGYEFEEFVKKVKPDLIGSGIKEKYIFQKMGIPFRQMHSWDYSGPYHGYDGFAIFARDMDMTLNNPCWATSGRLGRETTASGHERELPECRYALRKRPNMSQQVEDIKPSFPYSGTTNTRTISLGRRSCTRRRTTPTRSRKSSSGQPPRSTRI